MMLQLVLVFYCCLMKLVKLVILYFTIVMTLESVIQTFVENIASELY